MCQELQIFAVVYMYSGAICLVRLCDSDFGITPVYDITIGITFAAFCFHILLLLLLLPLCRVFTIIYLEQTQCLEYIVLQLFCIYNLCYM